MNAKMLKVLTFGLGLLPVGAAVAAPMTWRVDQAAGDDAAAIADTTGQTPFRRLQAAIGNASAGDTVLVGPGVYDEAEGVQEGDGRSRICIDRQLTLKASDPSRETAIVGAYDATDSRCGPNAVRCMRITARGTVLVGLELRGGATGADSSTAAGRSGGVLTVGNNAAKTDVHLVNCTVRDCVSYAAGAVYFTTMLGCRVTGCSSPASVSAKQGGAAHFTLFDGNAAETYTTSGLNAVNCTFYGNQAKGADVKRGDGVTVLYNALFSVTKGAGAADLDTVDVKALVTDADGSSMVDPAGGDFRVAGGGVAGGQGDAALLASVTLPAGYALESVRDPLGNAIDATRLSAGAVQAVVPFATLADDGGELLVEGASPGRNLLEPGTSLRVSLRPDATRPCTGLMTNGAFVAFDDLPERALALTAEDVAAAQGYLIAPVYTADWYMAEDGLDTNAGFTPKTPKRTFADVMSRVAAGDTVHLAAGTYAAGAGAAPMAATVGTATVRARVVVPKGVALVGAGRGLTVIEGADSGATSVQGGCGPDAMTCVFLNGAGAAVRRCTLRNGHTQLEGDPKGWKDHEQNMGGGVAGLAASRASQLVEDCTLVGCVAGRGAGAHNVSLVRCLVTGNRALEYGGAAYQVHAAGTAFVSNSSVNHTVLTPYGVSNCTIVGSQMASPGGLVLWITTANVEVRNTLVAGNAGKSAAGASSVFSHCLFATDGGTYPAEEPGDGCIRTTRTNMATDADGRPVIGKNAGIGQADETAYDFAQLGVTDLSGAPRVMNGTLDIGALEADYRPLYARAIGLKRGAVLDVTRGIVLSEDGAVRLSDGDRLVARWLHRPSGRLAARVSADAGATVAFRLGADERTVTGTRELTFDAETAGERLEVSAAGGGATFALEDALSGLMLMLR